MTGIVRVAVLTVAAAVGLFAIEAEKIKPTMRENIDRALELLKKEQLDTKQQATKIYAMFDGMFDYSLMARLSLGKHWSRLTPEQQEIFTEKFVAKLKKSYMDELSSYSGEKIELKDMEQNKSRLHLLTHIVAENDVYEITYKFYRAGENDWYIYDIDILGVSIVQTYRNQFSGLLEEDSFDKLLALLEKHSI